MKFEIRLLNHLPINVLDKLLSNYTDINKSIFIAGSMRSGTTFLLEMLESIIKYRLIFEPLSYRAKIFNEFHHQYYYNIEKKSTELIPFVPSLENNNDFFRKKLVLCFKGYFSNEYLRRNRKYFFTTKTIVKSVRSNLILDDIFNNITKNVILILRDPLDIWKSLAYMKNTRDILVHDEYLKMYQESGVFNKFTELNGLFKIKFPKQFAEFRNFIVIWIIQNYIPLRQMEIDTSFKPHIIYYKDLIKNPVIAINNILLFLNFPVVEQDRILKLTNIKSSTTKTKDNKIEKKYQTNREELSKLMLECIDFLPPLKKVIQEIY